MESVIEVNKDTYYLALRRTQRTIRKGRQNCSSLTLAARLFFCWTIVLRKNTSQQSPLMKRKERWIF